MTYDKDMTFSFVVSVTDGKIDTSAAEENFYAFLRKNEKSIIEEANDEEKGNFIENLSDLQEGMLKNAHMEQYTGTDDDAPDDYEYFVENLTLSELQEILGL